MQSLALCIVQAEAADNSAGASDAGRQDEGQKTKTGSLFGALAVIQATGQMILGVSYYFSGSFAIKIHA